MPQPNAMPDQMVANLRVQEGSVLLETKAFTSKCSGALVIAAVPMPPEAGAPPGAMSHAFQCVGNWPDHAFALAQFLVANPAYAKVVTGMAEVLASGGRLDGGYGLGCPVHDPQPDAPAPGGREDGSSQ